MQYTLVGSARALNWVLAATLATSAVASILQLRESVGFASFMFALTALLLVGVLLCWPFAYTSIATLSFIGVATALSREDLLFAVLQRGSHGFLALCTQSVAGACAWLRRRTCRGG